MRITKMQAGSVASSSPASERRLQEVAATILFPKTNSEIHTNNVSDALIESLLDGSAWRKQRGESVEQI